MPVLVPYHGWAARTSGVSGLVPVLRKATTERARLEDEARERERERLMARGATLLPIALPKERLMIMGQGEQQSHVKLYTDAGALGSTLYGFRDCEVQFIEQEGSRVRNSSDIVTTTAVGSLAFSFNVPSMDVSNFMCFCSIGQPPCTCTSAC